MTREVRTGPTQYVTRASSGDDSGHGVVMRGDIADDRTPEFVGVRQREKNQNEEGTTWSQLKTREQEKKAKDAKRIRGIVQDNDKNKGTSQVPDERKSQASR